MSCKKQPVMEHMKKLRSSYPYESVGPNMNEHDDSSRFADLQSAYSYTPAMDEFKQKLMTGSLFGGPASPPVGPAEVAPEAAEINANLSTFLAQPIPSKADQVEDIINSVYEQPRRRILPQQNIRTAMPVIKKKDTDMCEIIMWIVLLALALAAICWMFAEYDYNPFDNVSGNAPDLVVSLPK